jgi:hypothetical protein
MTNYISCADTAKLLRAALKETFDGIKFAVRSKTYTGGASITIEWTDGPNTAQVKTVADAFEGAYFDGGIDYQGTKYHKLDGVEVHFGANFIFESRQYSDAMVTRAIAAVVRQYGGCEMKTVEDYRRGRCWAGLWTQSGGCDMERALNQHLSRMSDRLHVGASPTLARLAFAGDDGYGAGTVGRNFEGGDNAAKGREFLLANRAPLEKLSH